MGSRTSKTRTLQCKLIYQETLIWNFLGSNAVYFE